MGEAEGGVPVDLRDDASVRSMFLQDLLDWEGTDLKRVYEPIADQISYVFVSLLICVVVYIIIRMFRRWREANTPPHIPYKVVKPPSRVIAEEKEGEEKKRVCAVLGGTGFIGSHIVDELVQRGDSYVYVLGRKFREERVNPNADALIQVDMLDFDGLVNALQGVDSLIDVAASAPNVYSTDEGLWLVNKFGLENVVKAAQKAGVKNFVLIGGPKYRNKPKQSQALTFLNAVSLGMDYVAKANGEEGMRSCVVAFPAVIGLRSPSTELMVSGKMTAFPLTDNPASFVTVEYAAQAVANAEQKLAEECGDVAGKIHYLVGEVMSYKEFLSLPTWPHKFSNIPMWVLKMLVKLNVLSASLTSWAPMGVDLSPGIVAFLELVEEKLDDTSSTYKLLEVGPPPSMQEYIKTMVEKYQELKKKK